MLTISARLCMIWWEPIFTFISGHPLLFAMLCHKAFFKFFECTSSLIPYGLYACCPICLECCLYQSYLASYSSPFRSIESYRLWPLRLLLGLSAGFSRFMPVVSCIRVHSFLGGIVSAVSMDHCLFVQVLTLELPWKHLVVSVTRDWHGDSTEGLGGPRRP